MEEKHNSTPASRLLLPSRTDSMQQLEQWVRTQRTRGPDDDTRRSEVTPQYLCPKQGVIRRKIIKVFRDYSRVKYRNLENLFEEDYLQRL